MRPRIVFLVMSAVSRPETIDQLAAALAPHQVLVHHDFAQTPDFPFSAGNVRPVPDPRPTGGASFGFAEGIFHSLAYAVEILEFDYLQLLSPTCLPIRPINEFESMVEGGADAHFGAIDLLADRDCLMSVGHRAVTMGDSFWHRVLRRVFSQYFHDSPGRRDEAGAWLRGGGGKGVAALLAQCAVLVFSRGWVGRHLLHSSLKPYYGSVWSGARRPVVQGLVDAYQRPGLREYFSKLWIADEILMPSLLMQLTRRKGPLSHHINNYQEAHPLPIDEAQLGVLRSSKAYFAREFPDDPNAPIRLRVLTELAGVEPSSNLSTRPVREPVLIQDCASLAVRDVAADLLRFSVVIPMYNARGFVQQAIASALNQSMPPHEVIVVDDGSTDDGAAFVSALRHPKVRLIQQANAGVSKARNTGIAAAEGDWVAFLDADDFYHPLYLEHAAGALKTNRQADMLGSRYHSVAADAPFFDNITPAAGTEVIHDLYRRWMGGTLFCMSSVVMRSAALRSLDYCFMEGESNGEDLDLIFRMAERSPVVLLEGTHVYHRQDVPGNLSSKGRLAVPPYFARVVSRSLAGAVPNHLVDSALWNIAQQRLTIARTMLEHGARWKAIRCLLATDSRGCSLRWAVTAIMMFAPSLLITKWQRHRLTKADALRSAAHE